MEERVVTVPLRDAKEAPNRARADKALKVVRQDLASRFKTPEGEVNLDESINERIWERGRKKIPSKVRIRAAKFDDGVVEAELAE